MKKELVLLLIITFVLNENLQAQVNKYAFGDSIFVWASSLNLRESANAEAKIVAKVTYGTALVIVDEEIGKVAYRYKALEATTTEDGVKTKPYYIDGFWVKVNYNGTLGYVFDGYLSKIKTKALSADKLGFIEVWAKQVLKLTPKKYIDKENDNVWTDYVGKLDIIRIRVGHDSKTAFNQVKFKNISFEEASMIGLRIFEGSYLMESNSDQVVFKSKNDNGDCEIRITKKEAWIVITLSCSC